MSHTDIHTKNGKSRRRPVTGLSVSATQKKNKNNCCWLVTYSGVLKHQRKTKERNMKICTCKFEYSYLAHGSSQQHLTCSFMPACLRCRTLVDTKVLLYWNVLFSVRGRLKAVLLYMCLRYVDTMAFGAWFVLLGVQKKKSRFKHKSFVVCVPWRPYC